jgi:acyl-CoA synthetase (NDP forming)
MLACHASLKLLPERPDCVVIAVPREGVEPVLKEAAALGVGGAVVFSSGFGEVRAPEWQATQERIAQLARRTGLRVLGPNCMGFVNTALRAGLTFIPDYHRMPHRLGTVGIVSQSGAVGYAVAQAAERGAGFSHFFSAGNSADIDVADLVSYLAEAPECRAIALILEGIRDAARLRDAGERAWRAGKPVVVYKIATGDSGAAAARSHTGSIAGSHAANGALFERCGFVVVEELEALFECAQFLARAGAPRGAGAAVVSGSGGAGVIAADMAERHGVPMPQPGAHALAALQAVVPEFGAARNPCDPTGQVLNNPESFRRCCAALLEDEQYGALVIPLGVALAQAGAERLVQIRELAAQYDKPIAAVWLSEWLQGPGAAEYEAEPRATLFRSMGRCFAAIAAWQARARRNPLAAHERISSLQAGAAVRSLLRNSGESLGEREAKSVLAAYGVPVVPDRAARCADEAAAAARATGFPVALKIDSPQILHKSEAGGVRLGLQGEAAVRVAFDEVVAAARRHAPHAEIRGVLVQPMAARGVEVMLGARVDPLVGPIVVVGLGGVLVEVLQDAVTALAPVSPGAARELLWRLRGRRLLEGYRGAPAANFDVLADAIARVSELVADCAEELGEIDVNPLLCRPDGVLALDALVVKRKD